MAKAPESEITDAEVPQKRRGALFTLSADVPVTLAAYEPVLAKIGETSKTLNILKVWVDLCRQAVDGVTDEPSLARAVGVHRSNLYRTVQRLEAKGVVVKALTAEGRLGRRTTRYSLEPPPLSNSGDASHSDPAPSIGGGLPVEVLPVPSEADRLRFRMQRNAVLKAFSSSLMTLAPAFVYGNRNAGEVRKETTIWVGSRHVEVVVRAYVENFLPRVADTLCLIPIHSYQLDLRERMPKGNGRRPGCVVDTSELCEQLGIAPTAHNKVAVFEKLQRFRADIEIKSDLYGVYDALSANDLIEDQADFVLAPPQGEGKVIKARDRRSFSLVEKLFVAELTTNRGTTPQAVYLELNQDWFPDDKKRGLTLPGEFLRSMGPDTEFEILLFFWLRKEVRHKHEPVHFYVDQVYRSCCGLSPHAKIQGTNEYHKFRHRLANLRRRRPGKLEGSALLFGYGLFYAERGEKLMAWADSKDSILGRESIYETRAVKKS